MVTGVAGAVGGHTAALAHSEGLRVLANASLRDEAFVRSSGASDFVVWGSDATARVREIVPEGVDAVVGAASLGNETAPTVRDDHFERGGRAIFISVHDRATDHAAIVRFGQAGRQRSYCAAG